MRTDAVRNRARILTATRELVAEQGPDVGMDAIAAAAGVAVGTLYRHYPTKSALVAAVVQDSVEALAAATERAVEAVGGGSTAAAELARLFTEVSARIAEDHAVKAAAAALGEGVAPPDAAAELAGYDPGTPGARAAVAAVELLRLAQAEGAVRPDVTIEDLALLLEASPGTAASDGARRRYVEIVLRGLTPA